MPRGGSGHSGSKGQLWPKDELGEMHGSSQEGIYNVAGAKGSLPSSLGIL